MTSGGLVRVLVLADTRLYREGLASMLRQSGRLHVSAEHLSAPRSIPEAEPDVVVVDAAACSDTESLFVLGRRAGAPVVAVGVPDEDDRVVALAEVGVIGFVERDASLDELVTAIEHAARGEATCPRRVTTALFHRAVAVAGRAASQAESILTARERQIVQLIAEGLSNKEIAQRLSIELATVKNHVHNILDKLDVNGRDEAVARLRIIHGGSPGRPLQAAGRPRA